MIQACLFVGLGGFIGSVFRYLLGLIPIPGDFPFMTFFINFFGSLLIGFIAELAGKQQIQSPNTLLFWKTGICGGFTTFSTFSLETVTLLEKHKWATAGAYAAGSVVFCLAGVVLGSLIARTIKLNRL